jgi:large subunit ribosomal protein L23
MYQIIKRPLVTEKTSAYSDYNTYVFEVEKEATKDQIKFAIEKAFSVKVAAVRTACFRTRWLKQSSRFGPPQYKKKAFVKLAQGQKISIFEGA